MNLLRAAEFKVGLLVIVVAGLIAFMSMRVSEDPSYLGRSGEAWFLMKDAGGLVKGSAVKSAGIPVGIIKNIRLQDGMARIELTLKPDFKIYTSASAESKAQGILGDKYISITPGLESDPPLEDGGQIVNVKDAGGLDNLIAEVSNITGSLRDTAKALQEAVTNDGTRQHILGRIVSNIEVITKDLSEITSENKGKINEIMTQVNRVTKSLDEILNDNGDDSLKEQLKRSMARFDNAMKNVDEITSKINRGEGTIGRLVNDEETVEELNTAISNVNGFLDSAGKLQTGLEFNSVYLGSMDMAKTNVGIRIQPGLDRYYYLGIVDDRLGVTRERDVSTTTGGVTTDTNTVEHARNEVRLTAFFAKNFYDFTVRGGIFENAGGIGLDYNVWRERLKLSLDAYDFDKLNLRAQVQYNFWKGVYVLGGVNDIMDKQGANSGYLGAGLLLTNDDLKVFMTKMPL